MTSAKTVYLDYAASAPARESSLAAERAYAASDYAGANPNSLHGMGRLAARALDQARADLARCLGGRFRPAEVTFTSGGTESNNLALFGLAE
ncbi:aminotransferase class V-fold PLP-dependent enzyme, partial [Paratractidigestivibacter sp.]